jgi:hypothetical protein
MITIEKHLLFQALSIHTFHGNGFVRSVDLLVLPNINPDAAFGMQLSIDDALTQYTAVTFQVAILYTSSKSMTMMSDVLYVLFSVRFNLLR